MKTILEWGWVAPDGRVIVGKRKDGTHEKLARSAGLGYSWEDAVKHGSVRYIIFTDGLLGLTLVPTKETISKAFAVLKLPQVLEVSIEWLDPETHQIDNTKPLTVRQAALNMRAKLSGLGRVANPAETDPGSADYVLGDVASFGLIDAKGKAVKAARGETSHNDVARRLGFRHTTDAMKRGGCVRFLVSLNGNAGFSYWADNPAATKESLARILRFVENEPSINGGFDWYNPYDNYWSDGIDYDEAVTALKKAIRTGNPSYHGNISEGQPVFSWGFISPTWSCLRRCNYQVQRHQLPRQAG